MVVGIHGEQVGIRHDRSQNVKRSERNRPVRSESQSAAKGRCKLTRDALKLPVRSSIIGNTVKNRIVLPRKIYWLRGDICLWSAFSMELANRRAHGDPRSARSMSVATQIQRVSPNQIASHQMRDVEPNADKTSHRGRSFDGRRHHHVLRQAVSRCGQECRERSTICVMPFITGGECQDSSIRSRTAVNPIPASFRAR